MEKSWYSVEVQWGWFSLIVLGSAILAFWLYSKKGLPWSRNVSILLGLLRMTTLSLLGFLLLNPYINREENTLEKPRIIIALDDSESIAMQSSAGRQDSIVNWVKATQDRLAAAGFEPVFYALEASEEDSISFSAPSTNLWSLFQRVLEQQEGAYVAGLVLLSDGIVNAGALPQYQPFSFPVYTIGLGDTVPPVDVSISNVRHNKIAFQGNRFPVRVELFQHGLDGRQAEVAIRESGKVIQKSTFTFSGALSTLEFVIEADAPGLRRFVATVSAVEGEKTLANNNQDFYIQIVEGKERILIVAEAPHPDINAIRSALAASENYEVVVYIPSVSKAPPTGEFSLVVEHGAFSNSASPLFPKVARWYIMSNRSNFDRAALSLPFFKFKSAGGDRDRVRPAYQSAFSKFKFNADHVDHFRSFPPMSVPFGNYEITGPSDVLLTQQVGSVDSGKPLMVFFDDGDSKVALTMGSGFWIWRMQESAAHGAAPLFDELVLKTIQYLSLRTDKKQFIATPRKPNFSENEGVWIDTEVYDAIYERVYGNKIGLRVKADSGNWQNHEITDNPAFSAFQLGVQPPGVYTYEASVTIGGKTLREQGQYAVKKTQLEPIDLQADHRMLRLLAKNTAGQFYSFENREAVFDHFDKANIPDRVHTESKLLPAVMWWPLLVLLFLLIGIEWILRKYLGAY